MSVSCERCELEATALCRSHFQRSPNDCGCVLVSVVETSAVRRPWPALGCFDKEEERTVTQLATQLPSH
jgi:hypothetical protein